MHGREELSSGIATKDLAFDLDTATFCYRQEHSSVQSEYVSNLESRASVLERTRMLIFQGHPKELNQHSGVNLQ